MDMEIMSRLFSAVTDLVTVAHSASINNLAEVTYCAWINCFAQPETNASSYGAFWVKDPNGQYNGQWMNAGAVSGQEILASYGGGLSQSSDFVFGLNKWSHLAFTFSNSGDQLIHIFFNGVEVSYTLEGSGATASDATGDLIVGNDSLSAPMLGRLYDFRVYNAALTAANLQTIISGGSSVNPLPNNLKCHLVFGSDSGSIEPDASGNNNPGVITGATFSPTSPAYNVPDCRSYGNFPNSSRNVNNTLIYDVQTSSNSAVPGTDSRTAGALVASGTYPQNSRTPGTYGPGE